MFQTAPGVTIPYPERIKEQFQVYDKRFIRANISYEKLLPLLTEFYQNLPEPLFFVLQLPLSIQEEKQQGSDKILHQKVCYLDGQSHRQIDSILNLYGQILLEDGMSQFAVASHASHEELFIQKYKVTDLYTSTPRLYIPLLQRYGLIETDHLITAWDTFSKDSPGKCNLVSINNRNAYDVLNLLKEKGMYQAKVIEG